MFSCVWFVNRKVLPLRRRRSSERATTFVWKFASGQSYRLLWPGTAGTHPWWKLASFSARAVLGWIGFWNNLTLQKEIKRGPPNINLSGVVLELYYVSYPSTSSSTASQAKRRVRCRARAMMSLGEEFTRFTSLPIRPAEGVALILLRLGRYEVGRYVGRY